MSDFAPADASPVERARVLIQIGRSAEAIPLLSSALAADPHDAVALSLMATARLVTGARREAVVFADRAIAASPHDPWPYRIKSGALLELNRKRDALAAAEAAVALGPEDPRSLYQLFAVLHDAGKRSRAAQAASRLAEVDPDSASSHFAMGLSELGLKRWRSAETHLREALRIEPDHQVAINALGVAVSKQGRGTEAVSLFQSAVKGDPTDELARRNLMNSITGLATGGGVVLWLALRALSRPAFQGAESWTVWIILGVIAAVGLAIAVKWRRGMAQLTPDMQRYVRSEALQGLGRNTVRVFDLIFGAFLFFWLVLVIMEPRDFIPATTFGYVAGGIILGYWALRAPFLVIAWRRR